MIENQESAIEAEVKRQEIELYNPEYIQLLQNPELEGELIAVSLVNKEAIRLMEESKSQNAALIDCKKEVAIISYWRSNEYSRIMCYRQL